MKWALALLLLTVPDYAHGSESVGDSTRSEVMLLDGSPEAFLLRINRYPYLFSHGTFSFSDSTFRDTPDAARLWILGGTMFLANAAIMWYYFNTFYLPRETERSKWHTYNDWYNADLNIDKLGHFWGTQAYANTLYHMFRWARLSPASSMYWSSGIAIVYQLEMEMTDAFYKKWGWSWWDVAFNVMGAVYPNLQRAWQPLQSIQLKMSYYPSPAFRDGWVDYALKDYDGFTYWLAFTVEDFLPEKLKPYWPDWLGVAVGYGGDRVWKGPNAYNNYPDGTGAGDQEWYISLDYDLRKLPGDSPFLKFLKEELNLIHLPAPAIRFTPTTIYYGLYF